MQENKMSCKKWVIYTGIWMVPALWGIELILLKVIAFSYGPAPPVVLDLWYIPGILNFFPVVLTWGRNHLKKRKGKTDFHWLDGVDTTIDEFDGRRVS